MPVHELGGATGFELLRAGKLGDLKTVLEGRELRVRRNDLGAKSRGASARELAAIELLPSGLAVCWPRLGIQVSISDLLAGRFAAKRRHNKRDAFVEHFLNLKGSIPADIDLEF
jgi:Protein of unknown function (DUF2442)